MLSAVVTVLMMRLCNEEEDLELKRNAMMKSMLTVLHLSLKVRLQWCLQRRSVTHPSNCLGE